MYPLPFEKDRFLKIDKKYLRLGDTALILPDPAAFLQRVQAALIMRFANQYTAMVASAQYRKQKTDPCSYTIFNRALNERWKGEIILTARMNSILQVTDVNIEEFTKDMSLMIRDISDISILCPVNDLVKGRFPKEILSPEYVQYLKSYNIPKKEVRQWIFNFAANVMNIVPTTEWIDKLETIFPKDRWKAVAQVEKLYADGDAMPRLAFFANNVRDQIYIHINRIECHFYEYAAEQKRLLCKLIHFAETECNTRFCHMSLETNADLGVVMNKRILSQTHFREERTCRRGDLFEHQFLEVDYKLVPSPFAIEFASRNWHYGIRLFTPDNEHTTWYDGDTVISFFDDAANSNLARIEYLMKGNVYGRYQKIR